MRTLLLISAVALGISCSATSAHADTALLLFDGATGTEFHGCLNCSPYEASAVCNDYGQFGSAYSSLSIWNEYGQVGSAYASGSPWNAYDSEGLRIVDSDGNYYGRLTDNRYLSETSRLPLAIAIMDAYDKLHDTSAVRKLLCD